MRGPRSRPPDGTGVDADDEFGSGPGPSPGTETDDARSRYTIATVLGSLVPAAVARRAVAVSIETDRDRYTQDDPVTFTVAFDNRLPLPVEIPMPRQRRWGWTVDGMLEATDERRYIRDRPSAFRFRGGERKQLSVTWNGRFERVRDDRHESIVPAPGEYEIEVFVATHEDRYRPSDSTTVTIVC